MAVVFQYTGTEAVEMIKQFYPKDWLEKINRTKNALISLSKKHNLPVDKAYTKFILPVAIEAESILFFAALSQLVKLEKMNNSDKASKVLQLEEKRGNVASQIVALENSNKTSYEDKEILRGYYANVQQEVTAEINELINSFEVVEPKLIIHQPGLFDSPINN
jgi:hypothetical protein